MQNCKISLFGHRDFEYHNTFEPTLIKLLGDMLEENENLEIYIGRNGEFDVFAASVLRRVKRKSGDRVFINLVIPYTVKDLEYFETYYDDVILPYGAESVYPKAAIAKRNLWMVDKSDLVICYVKRHSGGAYKAVKYALRKNKRVLNLATYQLE